MINQQTLDVRIEAFLTLVSHSCCSISDFPGDVMLSARL